MAKDVFDAIQRRSDGNVVGNEDCRLLTENGARCVWGGGARAAHPADVGGRGVDAALQQHRRRQRHHAPLEAPLLPLHALQPLQPRALLALEHVHVVGARLQVDALQAAGRQREGADADGRDLHVGAGVDHVRQGGAAPAAPGALHAAAARRAPLIQLSASEQPIRRSRGALPHLVASRAVSSVITALPPLPWIQQLFRSTYSGYTVWLLDYFQYLFVYTDDNAQNGLITRFRIRFWVYFATFLYE